MFVRSRTSRESLYFSKLALLELSGWVEESMDDIVLRCSVRCLKLKVNKDVFLKKTVGQNHGFQYEIHFRKMMTTLVGVVNVERIEKSVGPIVQSQLEAALGNLAKARNSAAHTHLKGMTVTIDAPSVTINNFLGIYSGLKAYDSELRNTRW